MSHDEELKDFIELQINQPLEMKSESKTLDEFWYTAIDMFLRFGGKAFNVLIPFATDLCEFEFSSLLSNKTSRYHLNHKQDLLDGVSKKVTGFEKKS